MSYCQQWQWHIKTRANRTVILSAVTVTHQDSCKQDCHTVSSDSDTSILVQTGLSYCQQWQWHINTRANRTVILSAMTVTHQYSCKQDCHTVSNDSDTSILVQTGLSCCRQWQWHINTRANRTVILSAMTVTHQYSCKQDCHVVSSDSDTSILMQTGLSCCQQWQWHINTHTNRTVILSALTVHTVSSDSDTSTLMQTELTVNKTEWHTCVKHCEPVSCWHHLRLFECDFTRHVNVKQVNLTEHNPVQSHGRSQAWARGGALSSLWKCCNVFWCISSSSKTLTRWIISHYFHNLSSVSGGFEPRSLQGFHTWTCWGTFVLRPLIL